MAAASLSTASSARAPASRWNCRNHRRTNSMARLLVVDDERNIRFRLASFFENCGHVVQTAENGQEAFELLAGDSPADLVLTDYRMAELDGVELLQRIKRQSP